MRWILFGGEGKNNTRNWKIIGNETENGNLEKKEKKKRKGETKSGSKLYINYQLLGCES